MLSYKRCTRATRESSRPGGCCAQVNQVGASSVSVKSLSFALFTTSSRSLLSAILIRGASFVLLLSIKGSVSQRMKSIDSRKIKIATSYVIFRRFLIFSKNFHDAISFEYNGAKGSGVARGVMLQYQQQI